jgi:outer membrane protein, heavy metal efflux system
MHHRKIASWLVAGHAIALCAAAVAQTPDGPSGTLLEALEPEALRELAAEVLERNPDIARARQRAAAAAVRAPQVRALPDPVAALTLFVLPPETRVGPQRLSASIQQKLPWFGKLALQEQAALYTAAAAAADVERVRLDLLTEARRLAYELSFLDSHQAIVEAERGTLVRFEKAAQARYTAGLGMLQEIVRIQAQITRTDTRLLDIAERRASLLAAVNALRDRPADEPVGAVALPEPQEPPASATDDRAGLGRDALARRPELVAADAEIAARTALIELAEKSFRPDVTLGLSYTAVGGRTDAAGRASPPPDDGADVLALTGSVNLPVWRRKLAAGVEEAQALRRMAEEDKRRLLAGIERSIGDLTARMPLLFEHWQLLETVLRIQAREALHSAETAYSTGKLNAVDLLDAEVVLFEVQIATARTRTDLAIARAELERAVARPTARRTPQPVKESGP